MNIDLPPGIDRAVMRILTERVGQENAIIRGAFVAMVKAYGYNVTERQVRYCVNQLRKRGVPICSTGGESGGYWYASDWDELLDYIHRELDSRISDLMEQRRALKDQAEKTWGKFSPEKQSSFELK